MKTELYVSGVDWQYLLKQMEDIEFSIGSGEEREGSFIELVLGPTRQGFPVAHFYQIQGVSNYLNQLKGKINKVDLEKMLFICCMIFPIVFDNHINRYRYFNFSEFHVDVMLLSPEEVNHVFYVWASIENAGLNKLKDLKWEFVDGLSYNDFLELWDEIFQIVSKCHKSKQGILASVV